MTTQAKEYSTAKARKSNAAKIVAALEANGAICTVHERDREVRIEFSRAA